MTVAACPACVSLPSEAAGPDQRASAGGAPMRDFLFALPTIHCAACINTVERGLKGFSGVRAARVNLTQKRLTVTARAEPGMEDALKDRLARLGYQAEVLDAATLGRTTGDPAGRMLLLRLGIAGFAAMNVMLLSVSVWSGADGATRDFLHWISAAIAFPTVIFAAQPFFRNAWAGLKARRLVMDTPISLAILLALGVSLSETIQGGAHAYFDAALSLTFFLLLGRYLDHRSRAAARSAAAELAALEVPKAERLDAQGRGTVVALSDLRAGDLIRVRPGMRVAVDGTIESGRTELDRGLLTGESAPVAAGEGDAVHAGETNLTGALTVRVEAVGADTQLRRIADLVRAAEASRNAYVSLADRAAKVYAPLVHVLAFVALLAWWGATGDLRLAVNVATAVLIITCPCALGLAVPAVMISASGTLFRRGVLLKDGTALERLARVTDVVLDKTGTLTTGKPRLIDPDPRHLPLAAALGRESGHPLARALADAAGDMELPRVTEIREHPGFGIEGRLDGTPVRLGRAAWVGAPDGDATATWLRVGDAAPVAFRFADSLRPGARRMLDGLRDRRLPTLLLSGDTAGPVAALAAETGIDAAEAGLSPEDKQARLAALKAHGATVLMLGDGLNDTAALAEADISIAPASGMDVTRSAADIVLMNPDLSVVPTILDVAVAARRRMLENFGLAAAYNLVAVPLALAGVATPLMAALAMSASSICVSLNALRIGAGKRGAA